jgi:hypothetical protein
VDRLLQPRALALGSKTNQINWKEIGTMATIGELLLSGAGGVTKLANAQGQNRGDGYTQEELEKAAATAGVTTTLDALTKEAEEKLGAQMAYLGYCFGYGMNKAAADYRKVATDGMQTAGKDGVGDPVEKNINDAGPSALDVNANLEGNKNQTMNPIWKKLEQARVNVGSSPSGGTAMNAGPQTKTSSHPRGASFRQNLLKAAGKA